MPKQTMTRNGVDTDTGLDFDARYTVAHMSGVAFYLVGYATEWTEETYTITCEEDGHTREDHEDPDSEWYSGKPGMPYTDELCGYTDESEEVENKSQVRAIMVGDDQVHIVDVSDLTVIKETDDDSGYCHDCGQTGCYSNRYV